MDFTMKLCLRLSNRSQYTKVTNNENMVTEVNMQKWLKEEYGNRSQYAKVTHENNMVTEVNMGKWQLKIIW